MRNKSLVLLIVILLVATLALTACFEKDTYTVTFDSNGGTSVASQTVDSGSTATEPTAPTKDGYTFDGWFASGSDTAFDFESAITANITLTAQWTANTTTEVSTFTVSFDSDEASQTVDSGSTAIEPIAPTKQGYTFAGWFEADSDTAFDFESAITADTTLTAKWTINSYTVTFDANNGTTATGTSMQYDATITAPATDPTKDSTAEFSYEFAGWFTAATGGDNVTEFSTVTGDVTYYAQYTATTRSYTVTFDANNGTTATGTSMKYGADITAPEANPTKDSTAEFSYEFAGWFTAATEGTQVTEFGTVTGDITYYAQYTATTRSYTVAFDSEESTLAYGATITAPATNPTKDSTAEFSYEFAGWFTAATGGDKVTEFSTVTGDITYYAQYTATTRSYTVTIIAGSNGSVDVATIDGVPYGSVITVSGNTITINGTTVIATAEADTQSTVYGFGSWSVADGATTTDSTAITATFSDTAAQYTYTFYDHNDDVLSTATVDYDTAIVEPSSDPERAHYTFSGWFTEATDGTEVTEFGNVTDNVSYYAQYTLNTYSYTFYDSDGTTVLASGTVYAYTKVSDLSTTAPTKEADAQYTYTFDSWVCSTEALVVVEDITFTASYSSELNSYTVTFDANNGTTATGTSMKYGADITAPDAPTKDSTVTTVYTFTSWNTKSDGSGDSFVADSTVVGDITYYAQYSESVREYTVTITAGSNGSVDVTTIANVPYGTVITVSGNTITINGTVVTATANEATEAFTFSFDSWSVADCATTDDATTITASFTSTTNSYTVTFDANNGTTATGTSMKYGADITAPEADPTKDSTAEFSYEFAGWFTAATGGDKVTEFSTVTGDVTYYAQYTSTTNSYTVTFDNNGTTVDRDTLDYGTIITEPSSDPTMESTDEFSYEFAGWNTESDGSGDTLTNTTTVSGTVTYYAQYTATIRTYTITWVITDSVTETTDVEYGTVPTVPTHDALANYSGWDKTIVAVTGDTTYTALWADFYCDISATADDSVMLFAYVNSSYYDVVITGSGAISESWGEELEGFDKSDILSITIGDGITSIPDGFMYGYDDDNSVSLDFVLQTVSIGSGVEYIGVEAFSTCKELSSVTLAEGITYISDGMFMYCYSLEAITIPSTVTSIGYGAFAMTALESITIPASVTIIDENAFCYCTALTSVTFAEGSQLTTIGEEAFYYCYMLSDFTIEQCSQLQSICSSAFSDCYSLSNIDLSQCSQLESIGSGAFCNCIGLISVVIPDSVTSIDGNAFYSCYNMVSIVIGSGVTNIGGSAFNLCYKLVEVYNLSVFINITTGTTGNGYAGYYALDIYSSLDKESKLTITEDGLIIRYEYGAGTVVNYIGDATYITIPSDVTIINEYAFSDVWEVTVVIPSTVATILDGAFYKCEVDVYSSSTSKPAGWNSYWSYENDGTIYWAKTVTFDSGEGSSVDSQVVLYGSTATEPSNPTLDGYIFTGWYSDSACTTAFDFVNTTITADTVVYAGWTEYYTDGLAYTLLDDGTYEVTGIGTATDSNLVIPATYEGTEVTSVGYQAFYGNTSITGVTFGSNITTIGQFAFNGCTSLVSVIVPDSVTSLGASAFKGCTSLESIIIGSGVTVINVAILDDCTSLQTVILYGDITSFAESSLGQLNPGETVTQFIALYFSMEQSQWSSVSFVTTSSSYYDHSVQYFAGEWSYNETTGEFTYYYTVTFDTNGGSSDVASQVVAEGNTLTTVADPTRAGHDFTYWYTDSDCTEGNEFYTSTTAITESITLYAGWYSTSVTYLVTFDSNGGSSVDSQDVIDDGTGAYATEPDSDPEKTGYEFAGWVDAEGTVFDFDTAITAETTIYATWTLDTTGATPIALSDTVTLYSFAGGTSLVFSGTGGIPEDWDTTAEIDKTTVLSVVIEDGITSIPASFMAGSSSSKPVLESISISNTVTSIGDSAFYYCTSLANITLPETITAISEYTFYYCSSLTSVYIPASVATIGAGAFTSCSALIEVIFAEYSQLTSIDSSSDGTKGGTAYGVFANCGVLASINLEVCTNLETIGDYAFSKCYKLTDITFTYGVTYIGTNAFYYCTGLTSIYIPASVTSIGISAFCGSSSYKMNLTSIIFEDTADRPSQLESIETSVFKYCYYLEYIVIPSSVTSVGSTAFSYCNALACIVFGNAGVSVTSTAFSNSKAITQVFLAGSSIPWTTLTSSSNGIDFYYAGEWSYVDGVPTPNEQAFRVYKLISIGS